MKTKGTSPMFGNRRLTLIVVLMLCQNCGAEATAGAETHAFHQRLQQALENYQMLQQTGGWTTVAPGPTLQEDGISPRVAELRQRLLRTGDLTGAGMANTSKRFDANLREALMRFQRRHGLAVDGIVGAETLAALNTPVANRIAQIRVNLRRMGEFASTLGRKTLLINVPAFQLLWLQDDKVIWQTRVQVGHSETPTPLFMSELTRVIVNPDWVMPRSIAVEEMLPRIQADPGYLAAQNIEVLDRDGGPVPADAIDWSLLNAARFPYQLVQTPCSQNALGRIKFVFPNEHAIYLHDTPNRALFEETRRAFSHGCIRAEDPFDLARFLLRTEGWEATDIERVLTSTQSHSINLTVKPIVVVVYWTAFVDDNGIVQFRSDIYGRDVSDLTSGPARSGTRLPTPTSSQPLTPGSVSSKA